jgi:hypothetical protein
MGSLSSRAGGARSSLLDTLETSGKRALAEATPARPDVNAEYDLPDLTVAEACFRHSGWLAKRRKVWDALQRTNAGAVARTRFACCGSDCWVQHSPSRARFRVSANFCKSRWCVPCGNARAARLVAAMRERIQARPTSMITLTLRHSATPLRDQLNRLYSSFNTLRRRDVWKCVDGAAAFCELKLSKRDGLWHVHLHVLAVGGMPNQFALAREWHRVTGDSFIVDVRPVREAREVAAYVGKYVTKPLDSTVFAHPARLDEAITTLRGRRLVNASGAFGKINADGPADEGPDDWCSVGRLDALCADASAGDVIAIAILRDLARFRDPALEHEKRDRGSPDS